MNRILNFIILATFAIALSSCCRKAQEQEPIKISIFAEHIQSAARQGDMSFRDAALKFRELGFEGVDVDFRISPEDMAVLDELGFEHAAVHAHIYFSNDSQEKDAQQCIDFMVNNHFDKVLLVPGFLTEEAKDEEWDAIISRTAGFAQKAAQAGIDVMLEDAEYSIKTLRGEHTIFAL